MSLIVIEGLDGSGKSTQIGMLKEYFIASGIDFRYIHFPRTGEPFYGELISRFLRGDFGTVEEVDPYLVALLYAGDRKDASEAISGWLDEGVTVLLDRYVYSNIAYQCAKISDKNKRNILRDWIFRLEFEHFAIPRPSLNIFLDVPFAFTRSKLLSDRTGDDRSYLNGNYDIHESDINFQNEVRNMYIETSRGDNMLKLIDCKGDNGDMLSAEDIHSKVTGMLTQNSII